MTAADLVSRSRHGKDDKVLVKVGGGRRVPGWVHEDVDGRGYKVSLRSEVAEPEYFGNSKVLPIIRKTAPRGLQRTRLKAKKPPAHTTPRVPTMLAPSGPMVERGPLPQLAVTDPVGRAVVKPPRPDRSPAYRAYVRRWPCCNCKAPPSSDPHHEGPHGHGQKTSDFNCLPLCRKCHDALTASANHLLPDPELSQAAGELVMRNKAASVAIMETAKLQLLLWALGRFPDERQIEVLGRALAALPELPEVMKGVFL